MIRWRFTDKNNEYEDVFLNYNAETNTYEEYKPYAIVHCETKEDFDRMQQALKEQKLGGWNNQWISVEDKLPQHSNDVLIQVDLGELGMDVVIGQYWRNEWSTEMVARKFKVLYWMPLPKPIEKER